MSAAGPLHAPSDARRAWRLRHWIWLSAWVVYSTLLGLLYVHVPPSPDTAVFDYIGWRATEGARLYVDVTEQNFPGQMWLQAASTALFGNHLWSFRLFDWILTALGGVALLGLLWRARLRLAGLVAVPFYQGMVATSDYWLSGQRDLTAALFLVAAGLAYHVRRTGNGRGWLIAFSALVCGAVLIRPTYLVFAPLLLVADLLTHWADRPLRRRLLWDAVAAAAAFVVLLSVVAASFWGSGALSAWFESTVLFNSETYSQSQGFLEVSIAFLGMAPSWRWYLALAALGAWFWRRDRRDPLVGFVFASIVVTSVVSGFIQGKGFGYHVAGLLPALAALGAFFVARTLERVGSRAAWTWPRLAVALLVCTVVVVGMGRKLLIQRRLQLDYLVGARSETDLLSHFQAGPVLFSVADAVEAADYIRATTTSEETVLTWGRALQVNFLASRASPLRFPTVGMLELAREPFSRGRAWAEETKEVLASRPPAVILVPKVEAIGTDEGFWQTRSPSEALQVVRHVLETEYVRERSIGIMDLYRRRK